MMTPCATASALMEGQSICMASWQMSDCRQSTAVALASSFILTCAAYPVTVNTLRLGVVALIYDIAPSGR